MESDKIFVLEVYFSWKILLIMKSMVFLFNKNTHFGKNILISFPYQGKQVKPDIVQ